MPRIQLITAIVVAAVMALSGVAEAQGNAAAVAAQRFKEGKNFFQGRQYEEARLAYVQAVSLDPRPEYLLQLARAELRAGRPAEAANHFADYFRQKHDVSEADKQEAEIDFSAAKNKSAEVTIESSDPGAEIFVDGVSVGHSPLQRSVFVAPGERSFEARKGDAKVQQQLSARPGEAAKVVLALGSSTAGAAPAAAAAPAAPALVPAAPVEPQEGADEPTDDGPLPLGEWFVRRPLAWVGAGLTVAGLGVGIGFAVAAKTHYDKANDIKEQILAVATAGSSPCRNPTAMFAPACSDYDDEVETGDQQTTIAIIGFGAAAVAGLGTITYYALERSSATKDTTQLVPMVGPNVAGLSVAGGF